METSGKTSATEFALLLKAPSVSIVATPLALGIGANTAIFSVVNAVRCAPFLCKPEQLMMVWEAIRARGQTRGARRILTLPIGASKTVSSITLLLLHQRHPHEWTRESTRLQGPSSCDLFAVRRCPGGGRTFLPEKISRAKATRSVLSQQFFGNASSDPNVVGQAMVLDGKSYQIVGVMPHAFSSYSDDR